MISHLFCDLFTSRVGRSLATRSLEKLHLGIKDIKIGPSLPAFIGPNVLNVLVEGFNIAPITTAEQDLKEILNK